MGLQQCLNSKPTGEVGMRLEQGECVDLHPTSSVA